MSKKLYFRTSFVKQRVSVFETLLKSARHHYYQMFPWIWEKLSWKKSFLVRPEILGLFVNTLTPGYQYSRRNMQYLLNEKHFLDFLFRFWNVRQV